MKFENKNTQNKNENLQSSKEKESITYLLDIKLCFQTSNNLAIMSMCLLF